MKTWTREMVRDVIVRGHSGYEILARQRNSEIEAHVLRVKHLEAVMKSYESVINSMEKENLIDFANRIPAEYRRYAQELP